MNKLTPPPDQEFFLPGNLDAEQSVIGAILVNNDCYYRVVNFLKAEDFFDRRHQKIFVLLQDGIDAGKTVNPVTLNHKLKDIDLSELGGTSYLARMAGAAVSTINTREYGEIVLDMSKRRKIIATCQETLAKAYNTSSGTSTNIIEDLEQRLHSLDQGESDNTGLVHVSDAVAAALEQAEMARALKDGEVIGVTTGLPGLDRMTGGLYPGDLIYIAGRPGMGKTALAMNIAKGAAKAEKDVAFFSLEMSKTDLGMRLISDMTHNETSPLPYFDARIGRFDDWQIERFIKGAEMAAQLPIHIRDGSNANIATIRLKCLKLRRKLEKEGRTLDLVIIDYIGLMNAGDRYKGNRNGELAEISRCLKNMAKDFNVPFVVLSQVSRNCEYRDDKRPTLSDLRESGALEQDANTVIFVFHEYFYHKKAEPKDPEKFIAWSDKCDRLENQIEIIVAKQRAGPIGSQIFTFFKKTSAVRG